MNKKKKTTIILGIVIGFILIAVIGINFLMPKAYDIEESAIFQQEIVESNVIQCIELLDEEDYDALQEVSTEKMNWAELKTTVADAKDQLCSDWGNRQSFGTIYTTELAQLGQRFATSQVTVLYDNITVTYTITFDQDMKLAGLYIK